ncbi:MAG: hypothetical protein R2855_17445 [Thermomicrobiales bacterium]
MQPLPFGRRWLLRVRVLRRVDGGFGMWTMVSPMVRWNSPLEKTTGETSVLGRAETFDIGMGTEGDRGRSGVASIVVFSASQSSTAEMSMMSKAASGLEEIADAGALVEQAAIGA